MGVNTVEREGISISHPSKFILVGTMNPEEGEIRPQLLDRFGLSVDIKGAKDTRQRIQIIEVVEAFEKDPESVAKRYEKEQGKLSQQIIKAREILLDVEISEGLLNTIAAICLEFDVHGHRADFLIARAAKTIAAFNLRKKVIDQDVAEAAELVLPHRMRRMPFEEPKPVTQRVQKVMQERKVPPPDSNESEQEIVEMQDASDDEDDDSAKRPEEWQQGPKKGIDIGIQRKAEIKVKKDKKRRMGSGRRAQTLSTHSGKYVKSKIPEDKTTDIAIDATIRASAARTGDLNIGKEDLREKVRAKKVSSVIVFVVDASGSMAAMRGMEMAKSAVMALLEDSYQKRDKVGFIAVAGDNSTVLLPPTSSVEMAVKCLKELPTAGRTPLSDGLLKGLQVLRTELWKNKHVVPIMVLVSDGRGNVPIERDVKKEAIALAKEIKKQGIHLVVIDSDDGFLNLGYNSEIAEAGEGEYYRLDELDSTKVVDVVKALGTFGEDVNIQE
jgi:magnesium chelatase subunit D